MKLFGGQRNEVLYKEYLFDKYNMINKKTR